MQVATHRYRIITTPGFVEANITNTAHTFELAKLVKGPGEPSMLIGDPEVANMYVEDEGRTLRIPARGGWKFYAIRDDHDADCSCGCEGAALVTFLLPEEY